MEEIMAKNIERAKYIKNAREEHAWPQSQLANIAGVNLRTIQRLERDGAASFETLRGVAQAFGIDVKELNPTSNSGKNTKKEKVTPKREVHFMPRLISGKNFTDLVVGSDQFQFEHDEDQDPRSIAAMKDILTFLKADVVRLYDADLIGRLTVESELSQEIKGLENLGYFLFGTKRVIPQIIGKEKTDITMCTIYMSHIRSPKIIHDKKSNMLLPAVLPEFAR